MSIFIAKIIRYLRWFLLFVIVCILVFGFYCRANAFDLVADNMPVSDFVDWYCAASEKNVLIGKDVAFNVSVNCQGVADSELDAFFSSVIAANGCRLQDDNGFLLVSPQVKLDGPVTLAASASGSAPVARPVVSVRGQDFSLVHVSNRDILATVKDILSSFAESRNLGSAGDAWLSGDNHIYMVGTDQQIELIMDLVSVIDVSAKTVLVEAIFVESSAGSGSDLGVSWSAGNSKSVGELSVSDALSSFLGGGAVSLFRGDFSLVVHALESRSDMRVLSRPSILVSDGKRAKVLVGQNIPVITGQATGVSSDTENPFQTIERKDVGVSLAVTPVVVGLDQVRLDLVLSASSVGSVEGLVDVATNQRDISTHVVLSPGQVVRLGGLVSRDLDNVKDSVPVLSSLPFIGAAFRSERKSLVERNLDIFISVQVI